MIVIQADFFTESDKLRLVICGHAGYAKNGSDIVCAAVSGIFYALAGYLANFECELTIKALKHGLVDIECSQKGDEAMKQACIGLLQMQHTYPGYVSVNNSLWPWKIGKVV